MDPMATIDEPEEDEFYVIKVKYRDDSEAVTLAKFRGFEKGMALWESPLAPQAGVPANVVIVRKIDTHEL